MAIKSLAITVTLPESVELSQNEARELLVVRLLDEGRLSQSQAAKALNITRREMLDVMGRHQVPIVRYSADDWSHEAAALRCARRPARRQAR